ncbi:uncharacterized protein [Nicotiana tomentosiformis]|uniref:uncharacterized protein n=1 Tax=Nicotiana tomentosiformis TaxID=4098 RepID=UPI00051C9DFC
MVDEDTMDGEENQEISSLPLEESFVTEQRVGHTSDESTMAAPSFDPTGNDPLMPSEVTLELQEHEDIENMLSIAAKGSLIRGYEGVSELQGEDNGTEVEDGEMVPVETLAPDSTTGEQTEGPDPSAQEEPSGSNMDKIHSSSQEPQEENENSEGEDYDNVELVSFINARSRNEPPQRSTSKRLITRLHKKEEFELVFRKSKEGKKKRRFMKDGKIVNERVVPPAPVVDIDDEVDEEPDSLVRKSSKKLTIPTSKKESFVSGTGFKNDEGETSSGKVVEELGEKETEELVEKLSKKKASETSAEKRKCARKSVKMKADASEEPGSSKKIKVGDAQDASREKLRIQKVILGQVKVGTRNQSFSKTTLEECECIDSSGGIGSTSTISQLINAQNSAIDEIRKLKARNAILEGQLSQLHEAPSSSSSHNTEVARLTKENADLRKQVEDLKEKLLNEQMSANARMDILLKTLASSSMPSPSSAS